MRSLLVVFLASLLWSSIGLGQGFGESRGFGDASFVPAAEAAGGSDDQARYFLHDQLLKLLVLLGFTAAAVGIILTRRFALRRWLLLTSVVVQGFVIGGILCPIAAVQNVAVKAGSGYLLLFLVPVVLALVLGRVHCGYVCPFGALQELLHVKRWRIRIPDRWIRRIGWLRWPLLAVLILRVLVTRDVIWSSTTPFKAFFTLGGTPLDLGISAAFILLSVFSFRPFCRAFCPLGALLDLVSRLRIFRLRKGLDCSNCRACNRVCSVEAADCGITNAGECLLCGECIRSCPTGDLALRRPSRGKA